MTPAQHPFSISEFDQVIALVQNRQIRYTPRLQNSDRFGKTKDLGWSSRDREECFGFGDACRNGDGKDKRKIMLWHSADVTRMEITGNGVRPEALLYCSFCNLVTE